MYYLYNGHCINEYAQTFKLAIINLSAVANEHIKSKISSEYCSLHFHLSCTWQRRQTDEYLVQGWPKSYWTEGTLCCPIHTPQNTCHCPANQKKDRNEMINASITKVNKTRIQDSRRQRDGDSRSRAEKDKGTKTRFSAMGKYWREIKVIIMTATAQVII